MPKEGATMCADNVLSKAFADVETSLRHRSLRRMLRLVGEFGLAESVVFGFARDAEAKCPCTVGHAERVAGYAMALGGALGLSDIEQAILRKGALLHDVGKIYIPDAILKKPNPLTPEEFAVVRQHPIRGSCQSVIFVNALTVKSQVDLLGLIGHLSDIHDASRRAESHDNGNENCSRNNTEQTLLRHLECLSANGSKRYIPCQV
jgi:hypothetical protein